MSDRLYILPDSKLAMTEAEYRVARCRYRGIEEIAAPSQPPLAGRAEPRMYTAEELERLTGLRRQAWLARARAGEIPSKRVGRRVLFPASVLDAETRASAPKAEPRSEVIPWDR